MAKEKTNYVCTECGGTSAKWLGKCPSCGAWNTLVEQVAQPAGGAANNRFGTQFAALGGTADLAVLSEIEASDVEEWAHRTAAQNGFTEAAHIVDIFGLCAACTLAQANERVAP